MRMSQQNYPFASQSCKKEIHFWVWVVLMKQKRATNRCDFWAKDN